MKNILSIFKRDVTNIIKNRAAIVVILAVMILPSMYAWFNIIPSWDPYSNTEGVSIAIVNLDEGAEVEGENINVGDKIVLSLLDNHKLGWDFVDEEKAMNGLELGNYYASIVIPKDFSEKLTSVLTDSPEKPVLDYYVNEKINAIAPKVTNSGASGIVESIQKGFVKVANEAIFTVFNDIGIELEENRGSIERMRDSLYQLEADLPEIERLLGVADKDLAQVEKAIEHANDGMARAQEISDQAETLSAQIENTLQEGDKTVRKYVPLAKQDLLLVQKTIQQIPNITEQIVQKGDDLDVILNKIEDSTSRIDDTTETLQQLTILLVETEKKLAENQPLEDLNNRLKEDTQKLEALKESIEKAIATLENGEHLGVEIISNLNDLANNTEFKLERIINTYESSIIPRIAEDIDRIHEEAPKINDALLEIKKANTWLLEQVTDWQENGGPINLSDQKENIETLLPIIHDNISRVESLLKIFTRVNEISDGRLTGAIERLTMIRDQLQNVSDLLTTGLKAIERGENISEEFWPKIKERLENVDTQLDGITEYIDKTLIPAFNDAVIKLKEAENKILEELKTLKEIAARVSEITDTLLKTVENPEKLLSFLKDLHFQIESGQNTIQKLIHFNERLQQTFDDGIFLHSVEQIEKLQQDLNHFKESILRSVNHTRDNKKNVSNTLTNINSMANKIDDSITELVRFLDNELMPKYEEASDKANKALKEGNKMLEKANAYFPRVYELLEKAEEGIGKGKEGLAKSHEVFPEVKEKVFELANRIRLLEEKGDLDQLINLMKNDPNAEGDFFADPILLEEHELFPIPNYGSAMSPFFTAMSLWVGALILVSTLIPDVPNKHRYKSYEAYFGRFLLFWIIGLVQSFIVTMGDMFLLKTFVAHKFMFVLFGFIISTAFVVIVYTLVSVFGNTGKVVAIILLVMQLGASGGTFPIQMTPEFFQKVHAFLPFTHALNLLREAVGGIIWPVAGKHILWLVGYMAIFFFIGIKLKARINKSSDKFLEKARESEVIL